MVGEGPGQERGKEMTNTRAATRKVLARRAATRRKSECDYLHAMIPYTVHVVGNFCMGGKFREISSVIQVAKFS